MSLFSIFFISNLEASFYTNNSSKDDYVLDPISLQYQYGNDNSGVGGVDLLVSKNVVEPKKQISLEKEDKTKIEDLKLKDRVQYYVVQKGDTLEKIAKKFHIKKETII
jgi:DNA-directed RNA polymerase sigma subunit (sigma70/sigma32)